MSHYPWLVEAPALDRRFDLSDVEPEHDAAGVVAVVLVQAADDVDDTELMLEIAASNRRVAGVVGWVPLLDPIVAARALDRWCDEPIVGVRHLIHRDPDPGLLADRKIDDVLTMLAERHLTFDVCAETEHLLRLVPALAERHPSLTLVIDHLAKPPIAAGGWQPWAHCSPMPPRHPTPSVKLSGLNTAAAPGASTADYRRYVDHALDVFGPERTMYGGDWPFALLAAGSYTEIWQRPARLPRRSRPRRPTRRAGRHRAACLRAVGPHADIASSTRTGMLALTSSGPGYAQFRAMKQLRGHEP